MKPYHLPIAFALLIIIVTASCKKKSETPVYDFSFPSKTYFTGDPIAVQGITPSGSAIRWDFGDNHTADGPAATHKYLSAGVFTITMTVDAVHITRKTITIAGYTIEPSPKPFAPFKVIYFASSAPATGHTFTWYFGDGTSSTEVTPAHIYSVGGTMDVNLLIDSQIYVTSQLTIEEYNIQMVSALPYYPGKSLAFKSTAPAGSTYMWSFGDSTTSTEAEPVHTYAHTGHCTVSLVVNNIPARTLYYPLDISRYPTQTPLIAGTKSWHHNSYRILQFGTIDDNFTYADTSFTVNYISDLKLSVGSQDLYYTSSNDSALHYENGDANLDYTFTTGHARFYTKVYETPPVGHTYWYSVDNYYTQ